ncbi:glycoside hydrolase family 71 protein [Phanerochaete sordida]|uniref:Glycoside hydrolase family 71 protein n=1 Tax=Phanerochaete sordida TaxID=48140 RepID=A0A9P3GCG0_9APHY|nr:glycoside hydrolase family 71 protein [Phanerochaete sordida]
MRLSPFIWATLLQLGSGVQAAAVERHDISTIQAVLLPPEAAALQPVIDINIVASTNPPTAALAAPQAASTKLVFAHHIVGNTINYTQESWAYDIALASSKGIDAFALNIGPAGWEQGQVDNAFAAAQSLNTNFKLFLSFDMSVIPCTSASDSSVTQQVILNYASHPNQLVYDGKVFVSTFAGEACTFGTPSSQQGWYNTVKNGLNTYFVPSFFVDPATFKSYAALDGAFGWNSGWPMDDTDITFGPDQLYISDLSGRSYMAAVSPWFFTHYGVDTYNKNMIYRADDWLLAKRWEELIAYRDVVDFVEINTWNDFGESHYVGPIEGMQPNSQAWVNGFEHTGWLDLIAYYASAFKTGYYPAITQDRTFLWARLFPAAAVATNDPVGKPTNWEWTEDYLWAIVQLTAPATVTLSCGPNSSTRYVAAGTIKLKLPLTTDCAVSSTITRDSVRTTFTPQGMIFNTAPETYNFNAFVAASPMV